MYVASFLLPWKEPVLLEGEGAFNKLPSYLKNLQLKSILIITDQGIVKAGLLEGFLAALDENEMQYVVFDQVVANPTIENIESCVALYRQYHCQGIVAVGGGSPMDCAKGAGARIARPNKKIPDLKGLLKVRKKLPPLVAVPTTAGTGSETTIAAVVTDSESHHKYAINDPMLIPHTAVMDPLLTTKLPKHITSTTGMDALCHAVEAYIGKGNTKQTKADAVEAVTLIFDHLYRAYENGEDIVARKNMQKASFLAGRAFTRAYVGWVHAIAHTLGGFYQIPHGLANAVVMPYVFRAYGKSAYQKLAQLGEIIGVKGDTQQEKAEAFIKEIEHLNEKMGIEKTFPQIREEDIQQMVQYAASEANPLYPTPKIILAQEAEKIYRSIKGK
ncbi:MAG: iron-containing alcohol dehydrogenase [Clostridiales bacterium]|nr:iron-containing alcohol dehydrogenase [Clostridiales bacterium]